MSYTFRSASGQHISFVVTDVGSVSLRKKMQSLGNTSLVFRFVSGEDIPFVKTSNSHRACPYI